MEPALLELFAEGAPDDEVAVILRLTDPVALPAGVRIVAQFGPIVTCRLRRGDIPRVRGDAPVRSMKAARLYGPTPAPEDGQGCGSSGACHCGCQHRAAESPDATDATDMTDVGDAVEAAGIVEAMDADDPRPGDQRRPDSSLPTGKNVVIAHIDWGCDFTHPDFRDAEGRTRLLGLWDQSAPYDERHPNRYGYGRIYDTSEIDRALETPDPCATLGYDWRISDSGIGTHGAHTLGISAGNGRAGGPLGLAPDAKLIFVHLSTYTPQGPALLGDSVALLESLDFIARLANVLSVVINASLGRQAGDHTGTTLTEQGMDAFLLAAPGRAIVQSTGNYYDRRIHAQGLLRPGEHKTLHLITDVADRTPNELDLWYPGIDRFGISVRGPEGVTPVEVSGDEHAPVLVGNTIVGRLYHRLADPNNGDNQAVLVLYREAPPGEWLVTIFGEDVSDGRYHAWVERDAACARCQARFIVEDNDPTSTTGTICNGLRTIAVGAYDASREDRAIARFSSSGPTRDGRQKPDLCAPGVRVLSARSDPRGGGSDRPLLTRMSGTSMAAPHVTGTIALMFDVAARPLFIEETRRLLLASTDPVPAGATTPTRWRLGSGYLNTTAAVNAVKEAFAMNESHDIEAGVESDIEASDIEANIGGSVEDSAEATRRDHARAASFNPLPFQFQIPLGGGAPGIAVPLGGAGSPFAFSLPLGGTPIMPTPVISQTVTTTPSKGTSEPPPPTVATIPDEPLYQPPLEDTGESFPGEWEDAVEGAETWTGGSAESWPMQLAETEASAFGQDVRRAADDAIARGDAQSQSSAAWLSAILSAAAADSGAGASGGANNASSWTLGGHAPSATTLFNTFVYPDHPMRPRPALRRHYARHFEVLTGPGGSLASVDPRTGDLLVRVAGGEGWGHIAVIASPGFYSHDQLPGADLRGEGYPRLAPGHYVHIVEPGPRPRSADDRFARRVCDATGTVLRDTLLLRPLSPYRESWESTSDGEAEPARATRTSQPPASNGNGAYDTPAFVVRPSTTTRAPSAPSASSTGSTPTLRVGASGADVRRAQQKLNRIHSDSLALGLPGLPNAPLSENGRFDMRMQQTVIAFQQQVFPDPSKWDGTIGPDTWSQFDALTGSGASSGANTSASPAIAAREQAEGESSPHPTVRKGSKGAAVREAQAKLNIVHAKLIATGAPGIPGCPLVEDGDFGSKTLTAAVGFQKLAFPDQPKEWDGVIGPKTWAALDELSSRPTPPIPPPVPPPEPKPDDILPPFPPSAVVDERIDVDAQFALIRMSKGTPDARMDAVGMLTAIKAGQLAGIFGDNLEKAAELAARRGTTRFNLVPKGEDAALILEPGDFVISKPPTIIFRGGDPPKSFGIRKDPQRMDAALRKAWATFLLLRAGKLGQCEAQAGGGRIEAFTDAEGEPLRIFANAQPILCELPDKPVPKPPKPPVKPPPPCAILPAGKVDPSTFVVTHAGTVGFTGPDLSASTGRTLKLTGNAFYPATADGTRQPFDASVGANKRCPIVFIAHGNHSTAHKAGDRKDETCIDTDVPIESFNGYDYFQEQLARMGIISVSIDCNQTNCRPGGTLSLSQKNITERAELIAAAIKFFQSLDTGGHAIFGGHIDFQRVGLMGHSRGGEAVVLVPELTGSRAATGIDVKAVLSLAPTDGRASSGKPRGYAFMTILPAGDGDVVGNDGARFYDQATPKPFKTQLYIHDANHNFFNKEWAFVPDFKTGAGPMPETDHRNILSVYGCALYRTTLLGHKFEPVLTGRELPLGARTDKIHLSMEVGGAVTVEDHNDGDPKKNSVGQSIIKFGFATADEKPFDRFDAAVFNSSFFGNTKGLILQRSGASNQYTSPLAKPTDLTGKEIWIRCAEVYTGSITGSATGFKLALIDKADRTVFIDSNEAGGLPRPFDRKADDVKNKLTGKTDMTKTMLKTLRFPVSCFTRGTGLDIKQIKSVALHLDRADGRALAFDQLQIV